MDKKQSNLVRKSFDATYFYSKKGVNLSRSVKLVNAFDFFRMRAIESPLLSRCLLDFTAR